MKIDRLFPLRRRIDRVSLCLLALLNRRARLVVRIQEEKRRLGLAQRDRRREKRLLDQLVSSNRGPLSDASVRTIFRLIVRLGLASARRQHPKGQTRPTIYRRSGCSEKRKRDR